MASGFGLEFATLGGFTFGLGVMTGTGALLIGHGLTMTTMNAKDISFRSSSGEFSTSTRYPIDSSGYPSFLTKTNDNEKKGSNKSNQGKEYKKPKPNISGKEGSKERPSWAEGERPYKGESGKDFAKRLLDERYGKKNHDTGPQSEFSKIKKYGDRSFE